MDSVRSFGRLWAAFTLVILAYAFVDLRLTPHLMRETNFTMQPDLNQLGDLVHWGGRLIRQNAVPLLVCNALVLGGFLALIAERVIRWVRPGPRTESVLRPSLPPR